MSATAGCQQVRTVPSPALVKKGLLLILPILHCRRGCPVRSCCRRRHRMEQLIVGS
jgi:hypothetical protein